METGDTWAETKEPENRHTQNILTWTELTQQGIDKGEWTRYYDKTKKMIGNELKMIAMSLYQYLKHSRRGSVRIITGGIFYFHLWNY